MPTGSATPAPAVQMNVAVAMRMDGVPVWRVMMNDAATVRFMLDGMTMRPVRVPAMAFVLGLVVPLVLALVRVAASLALGARRAVGTHVRHLALSVAAMRLFVPLGVATFLEFFLFLVGLIGFGRVLGELVDRCAAALGATGAANGAAMLFWHVVRRIFHVGCAHHRVPSLGLGAGRPRDAPKTLGAIHSVVTYFGGQRSQARPDHRADRQKRHRHHRERTVENDGLPAGQRLVVVAPAVKGRHLMHEPRRGKAVLQEIA
jgi:hypothetical protein